MNTQSRIRYSVFIRLVRFAACPLFVAMILLNPESRTLNAASAAQPIVSDSRIKTFVYNPNEVFAVTTHYGYQSNIEFAEKETIETVSVGDRVAWQIIPAGKRLFIRAMEENAHTNMTVVTNQHAYQFDLRSSSSDAVFGSEELTYVVRFYYPDANAVPSIAAASSDFSPMTASLAMRSTPPAINADAGGYAPYGLPSATPLYAPRPMSGVPSVTTTAPPSYRAPLPNMSPIVPSPAAMARSASFNYRYTYSGPTEAAPVKIYDDGASTYFRFPAYVVPKVSVITAKGEQLDVPVRQLPGNVVAVDVIAASFNVQQPAGQVIVYNESGGA